jgi:tripeptide aminopeptidase
MENINLDKELLIELLSIPSYSRREELISDFLIGYGIRKGFEVKVDSVGNIYFVKGRLELKEGESFPCVVAHTDTVHRDQVSLIDKDERIIIQEEYDDENEVTILYGEKDVNGELYPTGCGGDDKAGIFIALQLMDKFDIIKGAFFISEEIGCIGSSQASEEWLNDVGYFIQFDAPFDDWVSRKCSGIQLYNEEFGEILQPIFDDHGIVNIRDIDPFTDVKELKKKFDVNCINFFAGYVNMHTKQEFVVIDFVQKAINLGTDVITTLGKNRYEYIYNKG